MNTTVIGTLEKSFKTIPNTAINNTKITMASELTNHCVADEVFYLHELLYSFPILLTAKLKK